MASGYSFDIVSDYDKAEFNNVVDQSQREIANRYDLKGSKSAISWLDDNKEALKISADNQMQIDAIIEILRKKIAGRNQSQKVLDISKEISINNFVATKIIPLKRGLDQDKSKKISALIRSQFPKAKTQVQGIELRVSSAKKDELQAVISLLKNQDFDFPLQFTNYR